MKEEFGQYDESFYIYNEVNPMLIINSALYEKYTTPKKDQIQNYLNGKKYSLVMQIKENSFKNDHSEYLNRIYDPNQLRDKIQMLSQFYKYHRDMPYLYNYPQAKIMLNHKRKMRNYNYKFIKRLIKQQNDMSITTLKSSDNMSHLYSSNFIPKSKYSSILSALYRDTTQQTMLLEDLCINKIVQPPSAIKPKETFVDESYVIELRALITPDNELKESKIIQTSSPKVQKIFLKKNTKIEQIALHFARQAIEKCKLAKGSQNCQNSHSKMRKKSKFKSHEKQNLKYLTKNQIISTARSNRSKLPSFDRSRPNTHRQNVNNNNHESKIRKYNMKKIEIKKMIGLDSCQKQQGNSKINQIYEKHDKNVKVHRSNEENKVNIKNRKKYSKSPFTRHKAVSKQEKASQKKKNITGSKKVAQKNLKPTSRTFSKISINISKINDILYHKLRF